MVKKIKKKQPHRRSPPRQSKASKSTQAHKVDESKGLHTSPLIAFELGYAIIQDTADAYMERIAPHEALDTLLRSKEVLTSTKWPTSARFDEQLTHLQEAYMVGLPPISPISSEIFWCWSALDLKHGPDKVTTAQLMLTHLVDPPELTKLYLERLQESHFGVYVYEGHTPLQQKEIDHFLLQPGAHKLHLRELVTGRHVTVISRNTLLYEAGLLLFLRLIELQETNDTRQADQEPLYTMLHVPYVIQSLQEHWEAYFDRVLPKDKRRREASYLRLMRSERGLLLWLEYLHCAYLGSSQDTHPNHDQAIFILGVPDVPESMPYGYQGSPKLLKAKR